MSVAAKKKAVKKARVKPIKLDIACGQNKQPGFIGIDIAGNCDLNHDLNKYPWPVTTDSVEEAFCSHYVEHIPHHRDGWEKDGWWLFFEELHRVCRKDATVKIIVPYVKSDRAFWDPTHVRFVHEMAFYYLDPNWLKSQGLDHYPTKADFEVTLIEGSGVDQDTQSRTPEVQAQRRNWYWNVVGDLVVTLRVRK